MADLIYHNTSLIKIIKRTYSGFVSSIVIGTCSGKARGSGLEFFLKNKVYYIFFKQSFELL